MTSRPWQDSSKPRDERLAALIAEMTLEEKIAQLGSAWIGFNLEEDLSGMQGDEASDGEVSPFQSAFSETPWEEAIQHGLGQITRAFGTSPIEPREGVRRLAGMQRDLVTKTRLGIPAIAHEECLTGFTTFKATIYPSPLALASSFDSDLVERVGRQIGGDLRRVGAHQGLAPVLDVVRDYRWGRVEETMGEDPYLVSVIASAYVSGIESQGVIATLKHFVGYSASRAARNHAPVSMGRRELLDVMLPPFEAAIRVGGARSVMNSYTDVDGVPVCSDPWLLTDVLRDGIGFDGITVSDYWSVSLLADVHHVAAGAGGAGAVALRAGMDVELPAARCYGPELAAMVRGGEVPETLVDRALRRVLGMKLDLGLLDAGYDPMAGVEAAVDLDSNANRAMSAEAAEQGVVLVANQGILPLSKPRRVAVVGPAATDARSFLGCYSYPNHVLNRFPELGLGVEAPTLAEALGVELSGTEVVVARGCDINSSDVSGFAEAVAAAESADVVVVAVGDLAGLFGLGTSGEGCDAPDLTLPGVQAQLVEAMLATGKPVVIVCASGRPYAFGELADRASAVVQSFMAGQYAGPAIAGVLSGRINPSAHLPVQIPRVPHSQPSTYLQSAYGQPGLTASNLGATVAYPFGHGLSYTEFTYGPLQVDKTEVATDGSFTASTTVTNTGDRAGADAVQLYLTDEVAEVARPVQQLLGFARVQLEPGQSTTVSFRIHTDRLAYTGRSFERIVDAGVVELQLGHSCADITDRVSIRVTGPTRKVGWQRELLTPVRVG